MVNKINYGDVQFPTNHHSFCRGIVEDSYLCKFNEEILTKKRKPPNDKRVILSRECSSKIQRNLHPKLNIYK